MYYYKIFKVPYEKIASLFLTFSLLLFRYLNSGHYRNEKFWRNFENHLLLVLRTSYAT
jgi:hypothetical protein